MTSGVYASSRQELCKALIRGLARLAKVAPNRMGCAMPFRGINIFTHTLVAGVT